MAGCQDFSWVWVASKGHSGGLILGVKIDKFEIKQQDVSDSFIGMLIRNRLTNFRF
jgi:hypothetical protein